MLGILFLLICLFAFYNGARRGVALQLVHLAGFVIAFFVALSNYKALGTHIELYVPYIFFLKLRDYAFLGRYDCIISGVLNTLMLYVLFFGVLYILSFVPLSFIQHWFKEGELGYGIVKHTPILSKWFYQLLITNII